MTTLMPWPVTALKITWMWGTYPPALMAPPGAWVFLFLLLLVMVPVEFNMLQSLTVPSIIEGVLYTMMSCIGIMKTFVAARGTVKITTMENCMNHDLRVLESVVEKEAKQVNDRSLKTSNRFCRIYFIIQIQLLLVTLGKVLINVFRPREERQLPVLVPDIFLKNDVLFFGYAVNLLLLQYFYILGQGSFDTLFVCLCTQLEGKSLILGQMLARIAAVRREDMKTLHTLTGKMERKPALWDSPDAARAVRRCEMAYELKRCVIYHQRLIRFRDLVDGFFTQTAFYSLMYFVLALGAPALRVLYDKNLQLVDIIFNMAIASTVLLQLTFLCWFGDKVAESSEQVKEAAFFSYRQEMTFRARSALLMIILRAQKPLYITADRLAYLTVNLLMSVLRRSNSLYSAAFNLR